MELVSRPLVRFWTLCLQFWNFQNIYIGRFINSHHAWTDNMKHSSLMLPTYNWCWFHNDFTIKCFLKEWVIYLKVQVLTHTQSLMHLIFFSICIVDFVYSCLFIPLCNIKYQLQLQNPPDSAITRKNKTTKSVKTITA